jgi:membrane protein DedA with SNARE-associated domain
VQSFIESAGYAAIFLLMVAESACIPFPSEVTMLLGGALASGQVPGAQLNLAVVIVLGTLGNLVGSYIAWGVGRTGGRALLERFGRYILLKEEDLDRAERWFAHRGELAVFLGRLVPVVRTFISLPAGVAEMPPLRFGLYTLAGCLPWTAALAALGYALGSSWNSIVHGFTIVTIIIAVLAVAGIAWAYAMRIRRRNAERQGEPHVGETTSLN